jgi:putative SOS response-associated peptidase YedK
VGRPKERRQPIWFHRPDNAVFFFAGLYESWQPTPETWRRTFTIITTAPNALIAPIHDRMPVVLPADRLDDWLFQGNEPDAIRDLLAAAPGELLTATAVSRRVNSVKNDDPACLEPEQLL